MKLQIFLIFLIQCFTTLGLQISNTSLDLNKKPSDTPLISDKLFETKIIEEVTTIFKSEKKISNQIIKNKIDKKNITPHKNIDLSTTCGKIFSQGALRVYIDTLVYHQFPCMNFAASHIAHKNGAHTLTEMWIYLEGGSEFDNESDTLYIFQTMLSHITVVEKQNVFSVENFDFDEIISPLGQKWCVISPQNDHPSSEFIDLEYWPHEDISIET